MTLRALAMLLARWLGGLIVYLGSKNVYSSISDRGQVSKPSIRGKFGMYACGKKGRDSHCVSIDSFQVPWRALLSYPALISGLGKHDTLKPADDIEFT